MTENLLDATPDVSPRDAEEPAQPVSAETPKEATPPDGIPAKFWDPDRGELRADALVKSYRELERKLGALPSRDTPGSADDYQITTQHDLLRVDPEVNARLHTAGFTHDQAQLVYDLAAEKLAPLVCEVAAVFEADNQIERLINHFGNADRWQEVSRQIRTWGRANLRPEIFDALATTYEGVLTMHRMMADAEPTLMREGSTSSQATTEAELKQMMRDPRYWRDPDPAYVERVRDGFRRLYPS